MKKSIAYIGIGSNIEEPLEKCRQAVCELSSSYGVALVKKSSLYLTEPWGGVDQPDFINLAVAVETTLTPEMLLALCKKIEKKLGRQPSAKWGPRAIDLDLLLYGQTVIQKPDIILPHPQLHLRRFVLEPLLELQPDLIHPLYRKHLAYYLWLLGEEQKVELLSKVVW